MKEQTTKENGKQNEQELKLVRTGMTIFGANVQLDEKELLNKDETLTIHF